MIISAVFAVCYGVLWLFAYAINEADEAERKELERDGY